MKTEVEMAVKFILSYLYNNLPRLRVESFGRELETGLYEKLQGHWFPLEPFRDVQYRCVRVTGPHMDASLAAAALSSGLELGEIQTFLPTEELCMWLDPGEVTYRVGPKGSTQVLLDRERRDPNLAPTSLPLFQNNSSNSSNGVGGGGGGGLVESGGAGGGVELIGSPFSNASSSASGGSPMLALTPSTSSTISAAAAAAAAAFHLMQKSSSSPSFTAATFAQTKFGSTKLKSPMKVKTLLAPAGSSGGGAVAGGGNGAGGATVQSGSPTKHQQTTNHVTSQQQQQQQQKQRQQLSPLPMLPGGGLWNSPVNTYAAPLHDSSNNTYPPHPLSQQQQQQTPPPTMDCCPSNSRQTLFYTPNGVVGAPSPAMVVPASHASRQAVVTPMPGGGGGGGGGYPMNAGGGGPMQQHPHPHPHSHYPHHQHHYQHHLPHHPYPHHAIGWPNNNASYNKYPAWVGGREERWNYS